MTVINSVCGKLYVRQFCEQLQGHFFLLFSAAAPVTPFLPILAKQLGISPFGVGIIFAGPKLKFWDFVQILMPPLQCSAALWRDGRQASCWLAGRLSWTTTDSFPSGAPLVRFFFRQLFYFSMNVWMKLHLLRITETNYSKMYVYHIFPIFRYLHFPTHFYSNEIAC